MSKALDRLTLLRTFARIAERGSISAAARDLGLSQASASRQLAALEQRLGVQLITRNTHSLSITASGQSCLADARGLLSGWEALEERYGAEASALRGPLKIVAPIALGQERLAAAALSFQSAHPEVTLSWVLDDFPIRFAELGCDLWIKIGDVPDDTLIVRELARIERLVVAAPNLVAEKAIVSPPDLAALPAVALSPFEGGLMALEAAGQAPQTLQADVVFSSNNIFATRAAILDGIGYGIMPRWFVEPEIAAGRLIDILPTWRAQPLAINAAYMPAARQTRRLRAFIDHISARISRLR